MNRFNKIRFKVKEVKVTGKLSVLDNTSRFPLKNLSWIQIPMALKNFVLSDEMNREYAILSCNIKDDAEHEQKLKIIHMVVKKDKIVKKSVAGK